MKAIFTKYHGATDTKPARISASDEDGNRAVISRYGDQTELDGAALHRAAAQALCDRMGWKGELAGGSHRKGYVFVFVDS